jgi:molybdenum cofactor biosynthesis protein B
MHKHYPFFPLQISVVTVSDTRDLSNDKSGETLIELLQKDGHILYDRSIVKDDIWLLRQTMVDAVLSPAQVVIFTGGTGFTERDNTKKALENLLDKKMDGFGELFRYLSFKEIATSTIQSNAFAGFANGTLVVAVPGSPGACTSAWTGILSAQLNSTTRPCNCVPHLKGFDELCKNHR